MFREGTILPVVGVSFYQETVTEAGVGDIVRLEHEQGNRHSKQAVKVTDAAGRTLGYLPDTLAGRLVNPDQGGVPGAEATAVVAEKTLHRGDDGDVHGLRINFRG